MLNCLSPFSDGFWVAFRRKPVNKTEERRTAVTANSGAIWWGELDGGRKGTTRQENPAMLQGAKAAGEIDAKTPPKPSRQCPKVLLGAKLILDISETLPMHLTGSSLEVKWDQ